MTDELRDVQAIRADLAHYDGIMDPACTDRLIADVGPLLAALAAAEARGDSVQQQWESALEALGEVSAHAERAEAALANRDAKLAAVERTITDTSVTYSTFCGEECCKDRIAKTCSPMMVERDAIRAALSLSVPTSPQTETPCTCGGRPSEIGGADHRPGCGCEHGQTKRDEDEIEAAMADDRNDDAWLEDRGLL